MNDIITEEERIKAIPGKEMAAAIKSMNDYLGANGQELIVTKDTSKAEALANLLAPIMTAIEMDKASELPEDVIAFFNEHLVTADEEGGEEGGTDTDEAPAKKEPKAKKEKKEKKPKAPKAPKAPSNEQSAYDMVVEGKSSAEILEHFKGVYAGKGKDDAFIAKRSGIYENIGKRKYASENADFKKKWDAEKEAAKPAPPVKEPKAEKPAKEKPAAKKTVKPAAKKK